VLLAGPSGSGKSTLAAHLGWPVLRLDDFYREGTDPLLPRDEAGRVDWDDENAWNTPDALAAVIELATTGHVSAPVYALGEDRRVGCQDIELGDSPLFFAEGLFADRLVAGCRDAGVLADALVLAPPAATTFVRRLVRDVAEHRKPVPVLIRRGLRLWREQPSVVRRCLAAGMRRTTPERALADLAACTAPTASAA
jgi:uridine kinase